MIAGACKTSSDNSDRCLPPGTPTKPPSTRISSGPSTPTSTATLNSGQPNGCAQPRDSSAGDDRLDAASAAGGDGSGSQAARRQIEMPPDRFDRPRVLARPAPRTRDDPPSRPDCHIVQASLSCDIACPA